MNKTLAITTILLVGLINKPGFAATDAELVRLGCDNEVKSYGITDSEEYQLALNDCIESMTTEASTEQSQDDSTSRESE